MVEKIQANKCPNKTTKDIVDVMHTLKIMTQTFTSKNNIFKTNKGHVMYMFFYFKCCIISLTTQKQNKPLVMKHKSKNIENANKTHTKSKHHIKSISNDPPKKGY
jgi:hypothetical protein